jgi:AraC family transcriptional regulator of adaptative response/methylated-DNA-[protein]-cysteine methyltransferase
MQPSFFPDESSSFTELCIDSSQLQLMRWEEKQHAMLGLEYQFADIHSEKWIVVATSRGICYLGFVDAEETALLGVQQRFSGMPVQFSDSNEIILNCIAALKSMESIDKPISFDISATAFQWRVWMELLKIPRGKTKSYGDLALDLQLPKTASRAVGTAIGQNPIAVFIPCHRVVQQNGKLGGYR